MVSLANSMKHLKEEVLLILYNVFQKVEAERTLPNTFYEASTFLIPKPDRDIIRKENHMPIFLVNIEAKILNTTLENRT